MVYSWKPGSRIKASAEVAGAVMNELEINGNLTPKNLVEVSRPINAPLHNEFEWCDEIAAELYREGQAAHMIRCVVVKPEKTESVPVRAFFPVQKEKPNSYTSIQTIIREPDLMESLLDRAIIEMISFKRKYESIEALKNVCAEMENVITANAKHTAKESKTVAFASA